MAIEIISGSDAMKHLKSNSNSKYPTPEIRKERLFPHPTPECAPSFEISADAKVFTMGSCFAREVDKALVSNRFNVISRNAELSKAVERSGADESLYNKYTIHSIHNELKWALDPDTPYPGQDALVQLGDDSWNDPQLGGAAFSGPLKQMLDFRQSYCAAIARVQDADVLIITLGLVEAWYDKTSGLYLNIAPHPRAVKRHPERFELHVLEYQEIVDELECVHALVKKFCKPTLRMLFTVSPVPLLATFREQDVLVANTYSKAVQRAAIEKFIRGHSDVDYFPSYEFVTLGDPNTNWSGDYRHVNPIVVQRIMASVMSKYTKGVDFSIGLRSSEISMLYKKADYRKVIELYETTDSLKLLPIAVYRAGLAYKQLKKTDQALQTFQACLDLDGVQKNALQNILTIHADLGNKEAFLSAYGNHERLYPDDREYRDLRLSRFTA